ncbi:unnamed protein product [Haemonchus placei]|uniref:ATP-grasp domain-containing protein n=1 Tax=Haemonchus placei TaxID=6290 RepID=A0A0N4WZS2_HAEPC|nr:unnamed protein product [Haemonchus placei]
MASVLIIGNGGREHALAWRMAKSESVKKVWIAPGNGADFEKPAIDTANADEVVEFCQRENVSLIVVGPEGPLADGFVDRIDGRVPVFGPTRAGAQLEASKIYSKTFMKKNGLPTAEFASFSDIESAVAFIERCDWGGIVVKADGLAAGKGVVVADSKESAKLAAQQFLARADDCETSCPMEPLPERRLRRRVPVDACPRILYGVRERACNQCISSEHAAVSVQARVVARW